jgi:hypothetical protein
MTRKLLVFVSDGGVKTVDVSATTTWRQVLTSAGLANGYSFNSDDASFKADAYDTIVPSNLTRVIASKPKEGNS